MSLILVAMVVAAILKLNGNIVFTGVKSIFSEGRQVGKAADTKHSDDYHGKFNDEDNENEK